MNVLVAADGEGGDRDMKQERRNILSAAGEWRRQETGDRRGVTY
jgi:hypothetical protein